MTRFSIFSCWRSLVFLLLSCLSKGPEKALPNADNDKNRIRFKTWLVDTLKHLPREDSLATTKLVTISSDSLSLAIENSYDLTIDSSKVYNNSDIDYALWLLRYHQIFPSQAFRLKFIIINEFPFKVFSLNKLSPYAMEKRLNS